jgi:hypothetical protein
MSWSTRRTKPYTTAGIARLACIRCGGQAVHQWQICSDGSNWRPLCLACDIALNRAVLEWMGHPDAERLVSAYKAKQET